MKKIIKRTDLPWILLLSIIVLLPNIYLALVGNDLSGSFLAKIAFLSISVVIFLIPSLFFKAKIFFLFHSIFVLLAPIEISHIFLNKTGVTMGFVMALFDTDFQESIEVLSSMIPLIVMVVVIWVIYFVLQHIRCCGYYFSRTKIGKKHYI
jgi:glucan phosphoethanolaminetransferase (alkaline phosphatase superfamily)